MKLMIMRHGHASARPPSPTGYDRDRRLTVEGRGVLERYRTRFKDLFPRPDVILSSPYDRAMETATILASSWEPSPSVVGTELLAGEFTPGVLMDHLSGMVPGRSCVDRMECIAIVGHKPDVERLAWILLEPSGDKRIVFSPGAYVLMELVGPVEPGSGRLVHHGIPEDLVG